MKSTGTLSTGVLAISRTSKYIRDALQYVEQYQEAFYQKFGDKSAPGGVRVEVVPADVDSLGDAKLKA